MHSKLANFLNTFKTSCRMKKKWSCDHIVTLVHVPQLTRETGLSYQDEVLLACVASSPVLGKKMSQSGFEKETCSNGVIGGHLVKGQLLWGKEDKLETVQSTKEPLRLPTVGNSYHH